jgi:hypothetical protein
MKEPINEQPTPAQIDPLRAKERKKMRLMGRKY